jgi:hypothetical protein
VADRWIIEEYATPEWADYPTWMPLSESPYYSTKEQAQGALERLLEDRYQKAVISYEKDVRECAERAAVYAKAAEAVKGMPMAHIVSSRGYRTIPMKEPVLQNNMYRVARVTTFQERVQELIDSTRGESVDLDDLKACFAEQTES